MEPQKIRHSSLATTTASLNSDIDSSSDCSDDYKLFQQSADDYQNDSDENYSIQEQQQEQQQQRGRPSTRASVKRLQTLKLRNSKNANANVKRKPTRQPDPNVFNRNALMARENRQRKKKHLEILQQKIEEYRSDNKKLRKALKHKNDSINKLQNEQIYLKSIIANKSEIMTLLNSIRSAKLPITSSMLNFVKGNSQAATTTTMAATSTTNTNTSAINSIAEFDSTSDCNSSPSSSSLYNYLNFPSVINDDTMPVDNWDDIFMDDKSKLTNVNSEHNYTSSVLPLNLTEEKSNPGICLHLSSGRISLEFCAECHNHSTNAWIEDF